MTFNNIVPFIIDENFEDDSEEIINENNEKVSEYRF